VIDFIGRRFALFVLLSRALTAFLARRSSRPINSAITIE